MMTRRQESGMAIITVAVLITIILLSLCSCSTKQHVVETVYVHDTVTVHKSDTVKIVRVD